MVRNVAIVGVGQSEHGRIRDANWNEVIHKAVKAVLDDANLSLEEVEGVTCGSMPALVTGNDNQHTLWVDGMGTRLKPTMRIATCGTTGMSVFHAAYYHVASGLFDVVLALGTEKQTDGAPHASVSSIFEPFFLRRFMVVAFAASMVGLQSVQYMTKYGVTMEQAARVAVKNRKNASLNPYAHFKKQITIEEVLKSRMISYPLHLLDCCPVSDGACAIILASEEKAKKITDNPAWIRGVGQAVDEGWPGDKDLVDWAPLKMAAKRAYKMAGIENPKRQIDVAEPYNPFTYQELIEIENLGLCDEGQAARLVEEGAFDLDGYLPISPSGGVYASNPIGATAMVRVAEVALQVMGKAGKRQVSNVETALAHGWGGALQFNIITILGKSPMTRGG